MFSVYKINSINDITVKDKTYVINVFGTEKTTNMWFIKNSECIDIIDGFFNSNTILNVSFFECYDLFCQNDINKLEIFDLISVDNTNMISVFCENYKTNI